MTSRIDTRPLSSEWLGAVLPLSWRPPSPHHRHRKVHLGLAGQPGHGGHDRDSARTGQQGELLYTLHSASINIGHDKEQPIRRKNTLLTAVACVGVVSYVRMETYKCIKFNVTVTVKALVT